MLIGQNVTLRASSIHVDPSAMASIGVGHNSLCWANWFSPTPSELDKIKNRPVLSQLFISPYPRVVWPALIRLEVRLKRVKGAMDCLTQLLDKPFGLNIVTAHAVPSGHQHLSCHFILDASRTVFQELEALIKQILQYPNQRDRTKLLKEQATLTLARKILNLCADISATIESTLDSILGVFEESSTLLHTLQSELLAESLPDKQQIDWIKAATLMESIPRAVRCAWLESYFYSWLFQHNFNTDVLFRFNSQDGGLRLVEGPPQLEVSHVLNIDKNTLPVSGIGCFDRRANSVRFQFDDFLDPFRSSPKAIQIRYKAIASDDPTAHADRAPSQGVLSQICGALSAKHHEIIQVANTMSDVYPRNAPRAQGEKGSIDIVIRGHDRYNETASQQCSDPRTAIARYDADQQRHDRVCVRDSLLEKQEWKKSSVAVSMMRPWRLFISTRSDWFGNETWQDLRRAVKLDARRMGMTIEFVDFYKIERQHLWHGGADAAVGLKLEDRVTETLRRCNAMIQLLPRDYLLQASADNNNLRWMFYERAFATARNLPFAVCVDVDEPYPQFENWSSAMRINSGDFLYSFNMRHGTNAVRRQVRAAIQHVYNRLIQIHNPPDQYRE